MIVWNTLNCLTLSLNHRDLSHVTRFTANFIILIVKLNHGFKQNKNQLIMDKIITMLSRHKTCFQCPTVFIENKINISILFMSEVRDFDKFIVTQRLINNS